MTIAAPLEASAPVPDVATPASSPNTTKKPNARYLRFAQAAALGASLSFVPAQNIYEWRDAVASDARLSAMAKAHAQFLAAHASGISAGAAFQESSFASYPTLAKEEGRHRRTVIDAEHELELVGYIQNRRLYRKADRKPTDPPKRRSNARSFMVTADVAAKRKKMIEGLKASKPSNLVRGIVEHVRSFESIAFLSTHGLCDQFFRVAEQAGKSVAQVKQAITSVAEEQAALVAAACDELVDPKTGKRMRPHDGIALIMKIKHRIRIANPIPEEAQAIKVTRADLAPPTFDDGTPFPERQARYVGRAHVTPPPLRLKT
jgi:hypothetical protein